MLLFCRPIGEPYMFCGRLRLIASDLAAQPMRFLWQLLDVDALRAVPDFRARIVEGVGTDVFQPSENDDASSSSQSSDMSHFIDDR